MKQCYHCTNNIKNIDYKDVEHLKRFLNTHARIVGKKRSGICARHQRKLTLAIKRARFMALLPYIAR